MRNVFPCLNGNLRRLSATPRAWAVIILLFLMLETHLAPVRALMVGEHATVSLFGMLVYLLADPFFSMVTAVLLLILLFDVPMTDETQRYIISRTGRASWAKGQTLYIAVACLAYLVLTVLFTTILLFPHLDWSGAWGSGLVLFAQERMFEIYDSMLFYDPWLMNAYSLTSATLLTLGLRFLALCLMALAMCAFNTYFQSRLGFLVAAVPLMLDLVAEEYFPTEFYYALPITLSRLQALDYGDDMGRPNVLYALLVLSVLVLGLSFLCVHLCRRREISL